MRTVETIESVKSVLKPLKMQGKSIGFVPTMGFLHQGHLSLVEQSIAENVITVVSIFVNPAQFQPNTDLSRYPRDLVRDKALLEKAGVNFLFFPDVREIYPDDYHTWVEVYSLTDLLDGASRVGYFKGICTIVLKLFNIVQPDKTYFGQKDIQQARVIQKMIVDLHLDIDLKILPIIRENDGLAMSSRNTYLNESDRKIAPLLYKALCEAKKYFEQGENQADKLTTIVRSILTQEQAFMIDYIDIVDANTLQRVERITDKAYLALAVNLHGTRLIDNIELYENKTIS